MKMSDGSKLMLITFKYSYAYDPSWSSDGQGRSS